MVEIKRYSPVSFKTRPIRTTVRDHWHIAQAYEDEGSSSHIIDLSHKTRWDVQDGSVSQFSPAGVTIPESPGSCTLKNGILINRMNRTQASVWHLNDTAPPIPEESAYTDVTENTVFLAVIGKDIFSITEKLSSLDFQDPGKEAPFLFQGPFSHVPCQIVTLEKSKERSGILLTCSRGYGHDMVHAIMDAGAEFGLKPAGEGYFNGWVEEISQ